jgi:RNA polymerase sigma-70 factor, ECF subfamily
VQQTLLRGLEKVHLYQSGTDLRAWLFTLMHNQYVNSVRRWVLEREAISVEKLPLATPAPQTTSVELRDLEHALARLREAQRTVLLLVSLEDMKYDQVAQICEIPVGTVRSRLSRAREMLRSMLDGERPPSPLRPPLVMPIRVIKLATDRSPRH